MTLELKKVASVELRSIGLDERWLQDRIKEDPSLLGLGVLEIFSQEHRQPVGGRIDFLMRNDAETFYEVEVMLGTLDESHIIRAIEYWDVERQRRPTFEHRAVIVAENITSRFFNILRLLNRSVPMIAVQLNAFRLNENDIALHAVTVLNVNKEIEAGVDVDPAERTDRQFWQKKSSLEFLAIIDEIASLLRQSGVEPRITYNRHHIAMGTTGYNFCWFHPRKTGWYIEYRFNVDTRDTAVADLQSAAIDASPLRDEFVRFSITAQVPEVQKAVFTDVLKRAEELSKR